MNCITFFNEHGRKLMIDLKHLMTFRMVAKFGNFSRAAEALNYAQPTVSVQIKALEKELGYLLFERIGRHAILTQAGRRFLSYAERIEALVNEAQSIGLHDSMMRGSLTVCIVETICTFRMPSVLREFRRRFPNVQLELLPRGSTYMLEPLRQGELDLAIVLEAPFDIPSLESRVLWAEPLQVIAYPGHPLTKIRNVNFEMLQHEDFIMPVAGAHYRKHFERMAQEAGCKLNVAIELYSIEAIKRCVMAEVGLSMIPRFAAEAEIAAGQLASLSWGGPELRVFAQLIWHKDRLLTPPMNAFVNLVTDYLGGVR